MNISVALSAVQQELHSVAVNVIAVCLQSVQKVLQSVQHMIASVLKHSIQNRKPKKEQYKRDPLSHATGDTLPYEWTETWLQTSESMFIFTLSSAI